MPAWGPVAGKRVIPGAQGGLALGPSAPFPAPGSSVSRQPQPWVSSGCYLSSPTSSLSGKRLGVGDSPCLVTPPKLLSSSFPTIPGSTVAGDLVLIVLKIKLILVICQLEREEGTIRRPVRQRKSGRAVALGLDFQQKRASVTPRGFLLPPLPLGIRRLEMMMILSSLSNVWLPPHG